MTVSATAPVALPPSAGSRPARSLFAAAAAAALLFGAAGCDDSRSPTETGLTPALTLAGRLERGSTVRVVAHIADDSVAGASLTLSVAPAEAAEVGPDGTLILRRAGPLAVTAKLAAGGTATDTFDIVAPPTIVFDLDVDGNRDIYQAALDGGDLLRLTTAGGTDRHPTSAAGVVVFTSYRGGQPDLYSVPLGGGSETRLTNTTDDLEIDPALSADGQSLAYVNARGGVGRVWVAAGDGSGAVRASDDAGGGTPEGSPAWGVDGALLFTSTAGGNADLMMVRANVAPAAAQSIAAANTGDAEVEGAWSADGKVLAFISNRSGSSRLYLLDVDTGNLDSLASTGENVGQPTWLADGRLVYVTFDGSASTLRWIDRAEPEVVHDIPLPAGSPEHPAAAR